MRQHAEAAFFKSKAFLEAHPEDWATGDYICIEKVTWKFPTLAGACCLAGMNSSAKEQSWTSEVEQIFDINGTKINKMTSSYGRV